MCVSQHRLGNASVTSSTGIAAGLTVCLPLILLLVYSSQVDGGPAHCHSSGGRADGGSDETQASTVRHKGKKTWQGLCKAFTPGVKCHFCTHCIGQSKSHGHKYDPPAGRSIKEGRSVTCPTTHCADGKAGVEKECS